jgi:hypothetical protein
MNETTPHWEVLAVTAGDLRAELISGLLTAQGIQVQLSQEGAGRAIGLSVGPLGDVEILVPNHQLDEARKILDDYLAGRFENSLEDIPGGEDEDQG